MENKIIEIGKEIIYLSAKYSKYTEKDKKKLLQKFSEYKKILSQDNSKYSHTIGNFLIDLESDLEAGRKLEIDNIEHDNYLENYFVTQREINHYNLLINEELYINIFKEINSTKNIELLNKNISELSEIFIKELENISAEKISKNLLIFTLFERKLVSKALKNLYNFLYTVADNKSSLQSINILIKKYNNFIQDIYKYGVKYYRSNEYNIYYMKFETKIISGNKIRNLKKYNSSLMNYRTGNHKYEYKKLLKKILDF